MSMYNALFGSNKLAGLLLHILNLEPQDTGRFRDCYLTDRDCDDNKINNGELCICLYTRNGGGNRINYVGATHKLRNHPEFLFDQDDSFDCTYTSYYFNIPENYKEIIKNIFKKDKGNITQESHQKRFFKLIEKIENGTSATDQDVENALNLSKEISEFIKSTDKIL